MNDQTRRVAAGIEKFLSEQISSGSLSDEKTESLQVAQQCIQAVYELDESPVDSVPNLQQVLSGMSVTDNKPAASLSADQKEEAEKFKNAGNSHMSAGRVALAIESYTKALSIDPTNVIFYSNRAAAYQKEGKYAAAVKDCKAALAIDSGFVKAYTRLGAAYASQKKTDEAMEAYEKALELEPSNDVARAGLDALTGSGSSSPMPAMPGNMKMPGGMDLASLMNNPEMMAMAQNMMKSGAMDKMMRDPKMQKMMAGMMGGPVPSQPDEEE